MPLAYLDPGAGSLIAQLAAAGTAGVAVAVKLGWRRVRGRVRPEDTTPQDPPGDPAEATE